MIEGMFARVNLERKTAPKKFCMAANGEQVKDMGEEDDSIQDQSHINTENLPELESLW